MTTTFKQQASFSELVSNELTQIRISQFIVHFIFVEGSEITVESGFEHIGGDGLVLSKFEVYGKQKEVTVHNLLGRKIIAVKVESEDCLRITFDYDGSSIRIIRDPKLRESCSIYLNGTTYVIS